MTKKELLSGWKGIVNEARDKATNIHVLASVAAAPVVVVKTWFGAARKPPSVAQLRNLRKYVNRPAPAPRPAPNYVPNC